MPTTLALPDLTVPAGSVARKDVIHAFRTETVGDLLARLRSGSVGERIVYFYVTDDSLRLQGVVPTRRLLVADPEVRLEAIMVQPVIAVGAGATLQEALERMAAARLLALPVVDQDGRLCGAIDIGQYAQEQLDLHRREIHEEVFQLVGVHIEHRTRSALDAFRLRFPWLLCNVASGLIAAAISARFDNVWRALVALAFFVPVVLTLAESISMQSVTLGLRSATFSRAFGSLRSAFLHEAAVGCLLGLGAAAIVGSASLVWVPHAGVSRVLVCTLLAAGVIGSSLGFWVPRLVHTWRLKPAVASGPAVLALVDVCVLAVYLLLAAGTL
jgi:magnesium transporter